MVLHGGRRTLTVKFCGSGSLVASYSLNAVAQAADVPGAGMTGELYDVLVLGPAEATPSAEARLAAALAGRNGAPLTAIAQGLADGNLNMGQGLERGAAEALALQLQSLGAVTSIRGARSFVSPPSGAPSPTSLGGFRTAGTPGNSPLHGLAPTTAPGSGIKLGGLGFSPGSGLRPAGMEASPSSGGAMGRAPLSSPGSSPGVVQGLRPLGSLRSETAPFPPAATPAPSKIQTNGLGYRVPTGVGFNFTDPSSSRPPSTARAVAVADSVVPSSRATAAAPAQAPDPFANPEAGATLELDRDRKPGESYRPSTTSVAGASGLNVPKMTVTKSASGLDLAGEKRSSVERCAKHGLLYDNRKSSACRKCLSDGRPAMTERPGSLRASPARRALLGLLFGLVLGFVPAAYYSRQVGSAEVEQLRSEQKDLSSGPGNDTSIRRFDEIEGLVAKSRQVNMRNTLVIWLAASGLLMVAWYRVTA